MKIIQLYNKPVFFLLLIMIFLIISDVSAQKMRTEVEEFEDDGGLYLGVELQKLDDELVETFKTDVKDGLIVIGVMEDSPAEQAGIVEDDIIVKIDDKKVRRVKDVKRILKQKDEGDKIKIDILRDGMKKTVTAKLAKKEEDDHIFVWAGDEEFARKPWLGVNVVSLNDDLASYFKVENGKGVLVTEVVKKSPAEKAGLKAGDVITKVGDDKVKEPDELIEEISDYEAGDEVQITLIRKGDEKTVTAKLEKNDWNKGKKIKIRKKYFRNMPFGHDIEIEDVRPFVRKFIGPMNNEELDELRREMKELKSELEKLKKELE